jgi:replicative DNA helicase
VTDNIPPLEDLAVEQALLGAILVDNVHLPIAQSEISPDDFSDPLHGRIFETMCEWSREADGRTISPLTFSVAMRDDPGILTIGPDYFHALAGAAPALPNVRQLASIVRDFAIRRQAAAECRDATEALATSQPVSQALRGLVVVADRAAQAATRRRPQQAYSVATDILAKAERYAAGEKVAAVTTGLPLLDDAIGGMQGGDLIIVPGRSGMGKSALKGGISLRAAMAMHPTLVFSLEMKNAQWVERLLTDLDYEAAMENGWEPVEYQKFRKGRLTQDEIGRMAQAQTLLHGLPLEICDDDRLTVHDIAARARAFQAKHGGLGLIVIDYLQIIEADTSKRDRSREQDVTAITRGLKQLAKGLDWPVLAGAQMLTKGGDPKMANKETIPNLAMIRESGSIEMEADIIIAPHRKAWYHRKAKPDLPEDDIEMKNWWGEWHACKNLMKLYGLKFRHGGEYDLDLFCDMRSSTVRDVKPRGFGRKAADEAGKGLLPGVA